MFDKESYNGDYFNLSLPILGLKLENDSIKKDDDSIDYGNVTVIAGEMNSIFSSISYDNIKLEGDFEANTFYENFKQVITTQFQDTNKIKEIKSISTEVSFYFYMLFDWDNDINQNTPSIMTKLEYTYEREAVMIGFWKEYFKYLKVETDAETIKENAYENMVFKSRSDDLNTTINNHSCQPWGSNQVHHEHSFWNMFRKTPTLLQTGYTKAEIEVMSDKEKIRIKKAIRDGLLDKVGDKYIPNNKCRNPNGVPLLLRYTTNPKVRWDYHETRY